MDVFSKKKRSDVMSRIRSKGTKPEERMYVLLRTLLPGEFRIYKHASLPGRPDFLIPKLKLAVFVDGCFFHLCPKHGHIPKSNIPYWKPKLESNAKRDKRNHSKLRRMGFSVYRYWEHDLTNRNIVQTENRVEHMIYKRISTVLVN